MSRHAAKVLTDIEADPDDTQSLIRLLLYSNQIEIEGLVEGDAGVIAATQNAPARYYSRPDATHIEFDPLRTSLEGTMYEIALQRSGDFHWSLDYKRTDPGFEINDLGFHGRTDYQAFTPLIGMRWNTPQGIFRDKGVEIDWAAFTEGRGEITGAILADAVPDHYMAQLQAGLLVSGRDWVDYVSYSGGMPLYVKRVHPDPRWFEAITHAWEIFEETAAVTIDTYSHVAPSLDADAANTVAAAIFSKRNPNAARSSTAHHTGALRTIVDVHRGRSVNDRACGG